MTRDELVSTMQAAGYDDDSIASECISFGFDTADSMEAAEPGSQNFLQKFLNRK